MAAEHGVLIVFLLAYAGLALGRYPWLRLDRTGIALVASITLLAFGWLDRSQARQAIDDSTILLLFGLMLVSGQLHIAGFYDRVAAAVLSLADRPRRALLSVLVASGITSSLFTNDIVCLAFTPIVLDAMKRAGRNPVPYLLAIATGSNSGGVATLIGNPQNMLIGQSGGLSFFTYLWHMALPAATALAVNYLVLLRVYRAEFDGSSRQQIALSPLPLDSLPAQNRYLIRKTLLVTAGMLLAFLLNLPRDIVALSAAALVLVSRKNSAEKLYPTVDFKLLILFVSLFILTGAVEQYGLLQSSLDILAQVGLAITEPVSFTVVTVLLSNIVSNVPAVMLLKTIPGENTFLWELLAFASTIAGNLTLLGSIANLIVIEKAAAQGIAISFREYLRIGAPVTLVTLLLGGSILWLVHLI